MHKSIFEKVYEGSEVITAESLNSRLSRWGKYSDRIAGSSWAGATTIYKFERAEEVGFKVEISSEGPKSCMFYFRFASFNEESAKYINGLAVKYIGKDNITYKSNKDKDKVFYLVEYTKKDKTAMVPMLRLSAKNEEKVVKFVDESFLFIEKFFK